MKRILHPTYFPNLLSCALIAQQEEVIWEACDNFQKQTYRNRCYIATDQGKHMLNVPIKHAGGHQGRQRYAEVQIDYSSPWQKQHWKTLQTAYRTSPFFEYYEDEIAPIFHTHYDLLIDLNSATVKLLCNLLDVPYPEGKTENYQKNIGADIDFRFLVNAKIDRKNQLEKYIQVFGDRHGFLPNLSCLDLLFNMGPESLVYLRNINLAPSNA